MDASAAANIDIEEEKIRNDAKMRSEWCMGGPEELRRGNGMVKDPSGAVSDQFWSFLGVDFGAKNELFSD